MFDESTIHKLDQLARDNKWTYPQLFEALKNAGVDRYEVDVLKHEIKYIGGGATVPVAAPEGWTPLPRAEKFNAIELTQALERIQKGDTTYPQFLAEIAAAGVSFYRVDMHPRTVTYHGPTREDKLVEKVPPVKKP